MGIVIKKINGVNTRFCSCCGEPLYPPAWSTEDTRMAFQMADQIRKGKFTLNGGALELARKLPDESNKSIEACRSKLARMIGRKSTPP